MSVLSARLPHFGDKPKCGLGGSTRRELHQLDGVEVLHAAAHALGGVEQHVGLGGVGIAQQTSRPRFNSTKKAANRGGL